MKHKVKVLFAIGFTLLLTSSVAYAASSSDFLTKAQKYIGKTCDKNNLSEEKSLNCYLYYKVSEFENRISTIENNTNPPIDNDFQVSILNTSIQQGSPNQWLPRLEPNVTWKGNQVTQGIEMHGIWHTSSGDQFFEVRGTLNVPSHFLQPLDASSSVTVPVDVTVVWQNYSKTISTSITVPN